MTLLTAQVADMAQKLETQVWVLTGLTGFLVTSILIAAGYIGTALVKRVDKISDELEKHNTELIKVLTMHKYMSEKMGTMQGEIEEHDEQIRAMQLNCANNNHSKRHQA